MMKRSWILPVTAAMFAAGCPNDDEPIDMTATATQGGGTGGDGSSGTGSGGPGSFPGDPFTFFIEETTNFNASSVLGCTNSDLNQVGAALRQAMEEDGFVGDYLLNNQAEVTHFADPTAVPGVGEDDVFADAARVTVYAGHGNINSLQWGNPGSTGACSLPISQQMRLGTLSGDVSAFAMYVTSCTANVDSLTTTLGISQVGQQVGWHNSPAVPDSIAASFYEQTGTSIVDGDDVVPVHNREAWLALLRRFWTTRRVLSAA